MSDHDDRSGTLQAAQERLDRSRRLREIADLRNAAAAMAGVPEPFDQCQIEQLEQAVAQATREVMALREEQRQAPHVAPPPRRRLIVQLPGDREGLLLIVLLAMFVALLVATVVLWPLAWQ